MRGVGANGDVLGSFFSAVAANANDGADIASQRGLNGEWNLHVLTNNAVGGSIHRIQVKVGEALLGSGAQSV